MAIGTPQYSFKSSGYRGNLPTAWSLPVLLKSAADVTFYSLVGGGGPVVVPG